MNVDFHSREVLEACSDRTRFNTSRQSTLSSFPAIDDRGKIVKAPTFLVASMRSGTTLLRLMLDHHPELAFFHEFHYSVEALPSDGWPNMRDYLDFLMDHRIFLDSRLAIDTTLDYPALMNSFLIQKQERDGKTHVGATVHLHFDRLSRIWPDARFIHLVRDGRDVGRSRMDLGWAGNIYTGVQSWIDAERLWDRVKGMVPEDRRIEVRYEHLIREPIAQLERICDFLGLDYDPAMLGYHRHTTYQTPDIGLIDQWRTKLSRNEIRLAESRIGELLVDRGYELSGYEPTKVGPLRKRFLLADDRYQRIRARWRGQGTSLLAAQYSMRALEPAYQSLSRFRGRVIDRLNNLERSTLK
jgi:hypothetical protein